MNNPETINLSDDAPGPDKLNSRETITLPRWIVYFQGGLLGVIAATFFVFGLMVGNLTSGSDIQDLNFDCEVKGRVVITRHGQTNVDVGAVVLCLPQEVDGIDRVDPRNLHPSRFEPLNNSAIDLVHQSGGAVASIGESGDFNLVVDSPGSYYLLVISKTAMQVQQKPLSKKQKAALATFFLPVDNLIVENEYQWFEFSTDAEAENIGTVEFN